MTKIIYLDPEETIKLKGSDHRVLFQNAEGNINMGVLFNDPDVDLNDIYWYNVLSWQMLKSMDANEGLIAFDKESNTPSCYVELHRKSLITDSIRIQLTVSCLLATEIIV